MRESPQWRSKVAKLMQVAVSLCLCGVIELGLSAVSRSTTKGSVTPAASI